MPSNKIVMKLKAHSTGKRLANKTRQAKTAHVATPRSHSKQATVIALLSQPEGTTIAMIPLCGKTARLLSRYRASAKQA